MKSIPWNLIAAWFFVSLVVWIGSGFTGVSVSFTALFFLYFYAFVAAYALSGPWRRTAATSAGPEARMFSALATLLVAGSLAAWSINGLLLDLPNDARILTLLVPGTLFVAHLLAWLSPFGARDARRLVRVVAVAAAVNAVLSAAVFLLFNTFRLLPSVVFFVNPHYPSILFPIGGRGMVRAPGLFESGAANGSFLLLTLSLSLCYTLFGPGARRPRVWWPLILAQAALVPLTLTRRNLLALGVVGAGCAVAALFLRRRARYLALGLVGGVTGALVLFQRVPDLARSDSFTERLQYWAENLLQLYPSQPSHLLVGFGVTQSVLPLLPGTHFQIVDNMYLSLLLYGGLAFAVVFLVYYFLIVRVNLECLRTDRELQWLATANIVLTLVFLFIGVFNDFVFNLTESLPFLVAINLGTRLVVDRKRALLAPAQAALQ